MATPPEWPSQWLLLRRLAVGADLNVQDGKPRKHEALTMLGSSRDNKSVVHQKR